MEVQTTKEVEVDTTILAAIDRGIKQTKEGAHRKMLCPKREHDTLGTLCGFWREIPEPSSSKR